MRLLFRSFRYMLFLFFIALCVFEQARAAQNSLDVVSGSKAKSRTMLGNYGFLTRFDCQAESEIRGRIRVMAQDFGVREFQFYDWFVNYSTPVSGARWTDPFFHKRETCLKTLEIYVDEIHRQGGRAWAYVQAVGSSDPNLEDREHSIYKLIDAQGRWHWHAAELPESAFPTYFANAAWARYMVETWAPAIKRIGFDGIHWDTLGRIAGDYGAESKGFHEFLKEAFGRLKAFGLKQTLNFVDLAWWDTDIVLAYLAFPYVECWSSASALRLYAEMNHPELSALQGVFAMYPSVDVPPGWSEQKTMLVRWNEARKHHLHYLLIGDGARRMKNQYWPETVPLTQEEITALSQH